MRVEERGDDVVLTCSVCPFNTSWARGKIVKSSIQRSGIVDHVESVKHKQGVMMYTQKPIVEGLRAMTKQAGMREVGI